MNFGKFNAFSDFYTTQDRMNMIFDGSLAGPGEVVDDQYRYVWSPNVDIYETRDSVVLKGELPGIDKKNITVEIKEDTLVLKGERKFKKNVKEENYHRMERSYGVFKRSFMLPVKVRTEGVETKYKDGVLKIIMPKITDKDAKELEVKIL